MSNEYSRLLTGASQLGPYPMEKLTKLDKPTTRITDSIERFDEREMAFARARRERSGAPPVAGASMHAAPTSLSMTLMSALGMSASLNENQTVAERVNLPDSRQIISRHIKSAAYFAGADVVGVCELPQWAVYSYNTRGEPVECNHKYAICIVVDQGQETMEAADGNDWISASQSGRGYAMCGYIGGIVASYIRALGYPARLHSIRGYQVVVPPLLLLAGIGELCRANIVLNPFLGLRYKASVVTTDLPLEPDRPVDFGLQDFCDKCMKCADLCPSRSISKGERKMINGYERWEFNSDTCMKYRFSNPKGVSCGKCIKVCPWNKAAGRTHDLVRWMIGHTPFTNGFFVKMDDLLGYGKPDHDKKWWLDP